LATRFELVFRQEIARRLVCTISAQIVGRAVANGTDASYASDLRFASQFHSSECAKASTPNAGMHVALEKRNEPR